MSLPRNFVFVESVHSWMPEDGPSGALNGRSAARMAARKALSGKSRVPLNQRLSIQWSTAALTRELSRWSRPFASQVLDLKPLDRRALRHVVVAKSRFSWSWVQNHETYRRIEQLINGRGSGHVSQDDKRLRLYVERASHEGIRPLDLSMHKEDEPPRQTRKHDAYDWNIGVAILGESVFFYRTGHHRLAIALVLELAHVPVDIHIWDSRFDSYSPQDRWAFMCRLGCLGPWR